MDVPLSDLMEKHKVPWHVMTRPPTTLLTVAPSTILRSWNEFFCSDIVMEQMVSMPILNKSVLNQEGM